MDRNELAAMLEGLNRDELQTLAVLVAQRLQEPEQTGSTEVTAVAGSVGGKVRRGQGHVELKTINGCGPYAYRRWWEGKHLRSTYIGKVVASS